MFLFLAAQKWAAFFCYLTAGDINGVWKETIKDAMRSIYFVLNVQKEDSLFLCLF